MALFPLTTVLSIPSRICNTKKISTMKKLLFLLIPALILGLMACQEDTLIPEEQNELIAAKKGQNLPMTIPLPDDFRPIGFTNGKGSAFYVASTFNDDIYKGDFVTGTAQVFIPAAGPITPGERIIGITYDQRSDLLYACLQYSGRMKVFDTKTTGLVADVQLATNPPVGPQNLSFINDVVVSKKAVYFTDSFRPVIYKINLGPAGRFPTNPAVHTIALTGDFVMAPPAPINLNGYNGNGLVATPNGKTLILGSTGNGKLYKVNPATGHATEIDLGGSILYFADGLLLDGKTLYVVQNYFNQVSVVDLNPSFTSGTVSNVITHDDFNWPMSHRRIWQQCLRDQSALF
jgi:sugar lactone lactonase YvrE